MPVTEDRRRDGHAVPEARLGRKAAAVDLGLTSWIWIRDAIIHDKVNSLGMWLTRSLGVALHPTSLPGGRLGPEAFAFVDWLASAGGRWWQVLPLNPPDPYGSPYASKSAFATWSGLLEQPDARVEPSELARFEREHAYWIHDWIAYAGGDALAEQVRFQREWSALRSYAAARRIRIIGDMPIYVAAGSCDHLAHPELFLTDDLQAGAPPDPLNDSGQKWGNPLYDWEALGREGFRWWTERMRRTLGLVDVFRIDHFRGFAGYWTVPASAETARGRVLDARPRRNRLSGRRA